MLRTELAERIALRGADMILTAFGNPHGIRAKKAQDFVTETDLAVEDMYRSEIRAAFPDDGLLGEERGHEPGTTGYTWIFDPLDGTNNFARSIPLCGTIVALEKDGVIVGGWIVLPHFRELYYARKGEGAFVRNLDTGAETRLGVSTRPLEEYLAVTDMFPNHELYLEELPFYVALHERTPNIRGLFCAAHFFALIASGKAELAFGPRNNPWDVAAGCLLVEEAGGTVTDYHGKPVTDYRKSLVVTNGIAHEAIVDLLAKHYKTAHFEL
jgi:fructose-1,6-bisphosphatase/inositol monophosphatase family enzyme